MEEACVGNDYNLRSKGAPKFSNSTSTLKMTAKKIPTTTASATKVTSTRKSSEKDRVNQNHPTTRKPTISMDITQNIFGDMKLNYDVVEELKKMKVNITMFELFKITQLRDQLQESLQHIQGAQDVAIGIKKATLKGKNGKVNKSSVENTSSVKNKDKTTIDQKKGDPRVYRDLIYKKSRSHTSLFLLTFEIFNLNVHNYIVDSGASSNVIPYLVCKKLNAEPHMSNTNIIQLNMSRVDPF